MQKSYISSSREIRWRPLRPQPLRPWKWELLLNLNHNLRQPSLNLASWAKSVERCVLACFLHSKITSLQKSWVFPCQVPFENHHTVSQVHYLWRLTRVITGCAYLEAASSLQYLVNWPCKSPTLWEIIGIILKSVDLGSKYIPEKLTWQWKNDHLKMYLLLKMMVFHYHHASFRDVSPMTTTTLSLFHMLCVKLRPRIHSEKGHQRLLQRGVTTP